jgi:hypothetical protein
MKSRAFRLPLLLVLVCFSVVFLATERVAASGPVCTQVGTGFHTSDPIVGWAKAWCGSICDFQVTNYCQIGSIHFVYDCVDDGSGPHPANVQASQSFCSFCPGCGYMCC